MMAKAAIWTLAITLVLLAGVLAARVAPAAPPSSPAAPPHDPELARCRQAGEAASRDLACQRAWARARARFFGRAS
jgi:conjugative transfer region protein TrbK